MTTKYTVTVIPDEEGEAFSRSVCDCDDCKVMHDSQEEWNTFEPETSLQFNMKNVIRRIENRINSGWKSDMKKVPKRLGTKK